MNKYASIQAFKVSLPVLFGYIAIGIPFGLMLTGAGYPWWLAPIMSITMYAGAGQYVAVGLFASGVPLSAALLTMLMVNIRHIVYGLSLIEPLKNTGKWKALIIFCLTDETYALLTGCSVPRGLNEGSFYGQIALFNYLYWITGGLMGAIAGTVIPFSFAGIDFALTALFIVLLMDQIQKTKNIIPPLIGGVCAVTALVLFGPDNMLIAALAFGIALIVMLKKPLISIDTFNKEKDKKELDGAGSSDAITTIKGISHE